MSPELNHLDATAVLEKFRDGSISPSAYAESVAQMAHEFSDLNALQSFDPEYLVRTADTLSGAPKRYVIRPSCSGDQHHHLSNISGNTSPAGTDAANDAGVVEKITNAGGFIGAKAGMHELAFGITSNNAVTGPVRNPKNTDMIPGGSSGGTAAAIAAGIFPAGLGTDTGGSCRIPAALCGIVGFRPTTGRYDGKGIVPISHTRDTVGPLARSVRDIVLFDKVLSGHASYNSSSNISDFKIGVPRHVFFDNLDPLVAQAIEKQLTNLSSKGAKLVEMFGAHLGPQ